MTAALIFRRVSLYHYTDLAAAISSPELGKMAIPNQIRLEEQTIYDQV
jgi:hypothetical protein